MLRMNLLLLFLLIAGAAVLVAATPPGASLVGIWQPFTNVTDPHVQDLGKFAVVKHTKVDNDGLRFSKVVSGEMQIVAGGMNYRLAIDTLLPNGKDRVYKAEVFEQDWATTTTRKLVSFRAMEIGNKPR